MSFAYLVFAGLSAAIAAFSFYVAYLAINGPQSSGVWLFGAFGLLFSILPIFALIRILAGKSAFFARVDAAISPKPAEPEGVKFGPHWMMMLAMVMVAFIVISIVVSLIKSLF